MPRPGAVALVALSLVALAACGSNGVLLVAQKYVAAGLGTGAVKD